MRGLGRRSVVAAAATTGFDFRKEDRIDPGAFNEILWNGVMGKRPYRMRPGVKKD